MIEVMMRYNQYTSWWWWDLIRESWEAMHDLGLHDAVHCSCAQTVL